MSLFGKTWRKARDGEDRLWSPQEGAAIFSKPETRHQKSLNFVSQVSPWHLLLQPRTHEAVLHFLITPSPLPPRVSRLSCQWPGLGEPPSEVSQGGLPRGQLRGRGGPCGTWDAPGDGSAGGCPPVSRCSVQMVFSPHPHPWLRLRAQQGQRPRLRFLVLIRGKRRKARAQEARGHATRGDSSCGSQRGPH